MSTTKSVDHLAVIALNFFTRKIYPLRYQSNTGTQMNPSFKHLWDRLNRAGITAMREHVSGSDTSTTFQRAFNYFKENSRHRLVNILKMNEDDDAYLADCEISRQYLFSNLSKTVNGRYFDGLAFQSVALKEKTVFARCPFTGARVASRHSLPANMNAIFYRFESNGRIFYLAIAGIGSGFKKSALYFPAQELIVTIGDPWGLGEDDVVELKARMVCNFESCCRYLANQHERNRKTTICFGYYHFAHHFWNELSGISRLSRKNLLPTIDKFLVLREPLGCVERLFSEIPADKIERYKDADRLFHQVLANNYFVVKIGDESIPKSLAERVYRVAVKNCRADTVARVREAKEKYYPLLWVGIRVGTRSWTGQVEGLANLIGALHREYPKLGIIFDGFSIPADRSDDRGSDSEYAEILAAENAVVSAIVDRLAGPRRAGELGVFNIVGSSIYDANVWAHAIDLYVSPHGTIQHKVAWLARKPGVIHTNQTVLRNGSKYIWAVVEAGIKPRYVAGITPKNGNERQGKGVLYRKVSDLREIGAGLTAGVQRVEGSDDFDNYEVDWQAIHRNLQKIIAVPRSFYRMDPSVWVERAKQRTKRTLRSVTRTLDYSKI